MKKTLIIILLLTTICQSQTILDPNPLSLTFRSMFSGQDTTGALSYHYFPQNKFTIGWQWGHHPNGLDAPDAIPSLPHASNPVCNPII